VHIARIAELEAQQQSRVWRVRGYLSHQMPLWGSADVVLGDIQQRALHVEASSLTFYLHLGGEQAFYFDLLGNPDGTAKCVEVQVETALPSNALLLAKKPLNQLLDVFAKNWDLPVAYQRFELLTLNSDDVLAYEVTVTGRDGLRIGELGGFHQQPMFAVYDAIYREALISTSPFYKLLCACRLYEGTNSLRKSLRSLAERFTVTDKLPADPRVNPDDLVSAGASGTWVSEIDTAGDLFDKFRDYRNAIAHFLIDGDEGEAHVYIADGAAWREYSMASSMLLKYASLAIEELRQFYGKHFEARLSRGSVLPERRHRNRYVIRENM
jgi:hypothetical protein